MSNDVSLNKVKDYIHYLEYDKLKNKLDGGMNPNLKDDEGNTLLHCVVSVLIVYNNIIGLSNKKYEKYKEMIKLLLDYGADPNLDNKNVNLFDFTKELKYNDIYNLMLKYTNNN